MLIDTDALVWFFRSAESAQARHAETANARHFRPWRTPTFDTISHDATRVCSPIP